MGFYAMFDWQGLRRRFLRLLSRKAISGI